MFELFLSLIAVEYYGRVPNPKDGDLSQVEIFHLEENDWPLLNEDFVDSVNDLCGTLLDLGDVDFFDVEQCERLSTWLENQLFNEQVQGRLRELYTKLNGYAKRAAELGTGVVVEF